MPATEHEDLLEGVRAFVVREVRPNVAKYEHTDTYPEPLLARMGELGLFGLLIPDRYGGLGLSFRACADMLMELSQGWMVLSGVLTSHFTSAWMIDAFGTEAQKQRLLPAMASGALRFSFSMTEPDAGSDVQAIRTMARRDGGDFRISGQKTWTTHGLNSGAIMLLAVTDPNAQPRHRGMTAFIVEKEPGARSMDGLQISAGIRKLGYKGVEATELFLDNLLVPATDVLGGEQAVGAGFRQFMAGMEVGRLSVASSATGIATAAFKAAIGYAQSRRAFGQPISGHQAIQMRLAQMATKVEAARLLVINAAERKDSGARADLEMGMAKLFATETAAEVAFDAMRVHGGYGYSMEYDVERLYRETPSLVLGEGSNEIQQLVIARRLLERDATTT